MPKYLRHAILVLSVLYALAAVYCYLLHFAAIGVRLSQTLFPAASVAFPYILILALYRLAPDRQSQLIVDTLSVVAALIGAWAYADSFRPHVIADMYVVTYVAIPALQVAIVVGGALIVWLQRFVARRKSA